MSTQNDDTSVGNGTPGDPEEAASEREETESQPPEQEPDPLEALAAERDKLKEQLLRTAADFDNFRKRARRDLEQAGRRGKEEALRELLPVIDNLERGLHAAGDAADVSSVTEGVRMVLKQFEDAAQRLGLQRVAAVGERFDPNVHEAIQQVETDQHEPATVISEAVPGYSLDGRLLRAAMVVVARRPSGQNAGDGGQAASGDGESNPPETQA